MNLFSVDTMFKFEMSQNINVVFVYGFRVFTLMSLQR